MEVQRIFVCRPDGGEGDILGDGSGGGVVGRGVREDEFAAVVAPMVEGVALPRGHGDAAVSALGLRDGGTAGNIPHGVRLEGGGASRRVERDGVVGGGHRTAAAAALLGVGIARREQRSREREEEHGEQDASCLLLHKHLLPSGGRYPRARAYFLNYLQPLYNTRAQIQH